ncbi:MAG TPA: FecR domain-containing protein [Puia sp.]|nr:FecR domain-containing protein [Puia sp.]
MQEQIRELLARYIQGECTEQEIALLERWFDRVTASGREARILNAADEERLVLELWEAVAAREEQGDEAAEGEAEEEPEAEKARITRIRTRRIWRAAAVWIGLIVLGGGAWMQLQRKTTPAGLQKQPAYIEVATGYQQLRKVRLPDSSVVWLNSATHLSFDSDFINHREVRLSGEAFFEVRTDARHPFVVKAGGVSTQVLGTSFNVSAYPEAGEMRVSLKTGKVAVDYGANSRQMLVPGQLVVCEKGTGGERVIKQEPAEMDVWTGGRLVFYETPMKEALAQIEARYGIHIIYDRPIKDGNITARVENTVLEKVLARLTFGWDLHFVRKGDTLHVR